MISLGANYYWWARTNSDDEANEQYPLLAKRILIENPNDIIIAFNPLRKKIREKTETWGESFALYFEYLPTGVSIGVNEKLEFSPRSLIKVPIVMALYRYQERVGLAIDGELEIKSSQLDNRFGDLWKRGAGAKISLQDAVTLALTESDNTAANILSDAIPLVDYKEIYEGLDINFPEDNTELKLSAKQYASVLKALYFSSLLSKENSQKILGLLTHTVFTDKLSFPISKDILVAHKVGNLADELFQDCGIIYLPQRQYLLCMISQSTESEARSRMQLISREIFNYLQSIPR